MQNFDVSRNLQFNLRPPSRPTHLLQPRSPNWHLFPALARSCRPSGIRSEFACPKSGSAGRFFWPTHKQHKDNSASPAKLLSIAVELVSARAYGFSKRLFAREAPPAVTAQGGSKLLQKSSTAQPLFAVVYYGLLHWHSMWCSPDGRSTLQISQGLSPMEFSGFKQMLGCCGGSTACWNKSEITLQCDQLHGAGCNCGPAAGRSRQDDPCLDPAIEEVGPQVCPLSRLTELITRRNLQRASPSVLRPNQPLMMSIKVESSQRCQLLI
jgi:hypothetical protein